jgi:hypothetical protein
VRARSDGDSIVMTKAGQTPLTKGGLGGAGPCRGPRSVATTSRGPQAAWRRADADHALPQTLLV